VNNLPLIYQSHPSVPVRTSTRSGGRPHGATDRVPRLKRADSGDLGNFEPTRRDVAILEALCQYRALTTDQISALLFAPTTHTKCRERLQKLFHHGYLFRREQLQFPSEPRKPLIYFLDRGGVNKLAEFYQLSPKELDFDPDDRHLKYLFIDHMLSINDIRIVLNQSVKANGYTLVTSRDERTLERAHKKDVITITKLNGAKLTTRLYPDYFFALQTERGVMPRFLEVDRSTETVRATNEQTRSWIGKVDRYLAYYYQGFFKKRYNTESMGVLTITQSEERLQNLKRATEEREGRSEFWFTTFDRLNRANTDILTSPVWERATTSELYSVING
jgi:hypothetical protein